MRPLADIDEPVTEPGTSPLRTYLLLNLDRILQPSPTDQFSPIMVEDIEKHHVDGQSSLLGEVVHDTFR
jgi:hypothetical protein